MRVIPCENVRENSDRANSNAVYRKWCARHPGFDESGRVHIVAHSIGAVLISHVLSCQPTWVSPLCDRPLSEQRPDHELLFNTGALFMAGSPLAMFMSLDQSTLIARKVSPVSAP